VTQYSAVEILKSDRHVYLIIMT